MDNLFFWEKKYVGGNLLISFGRVEFGGLIEPGLITFFLGRQLVWKSSISAKIFAYTNSKLEYYKQMAQDKKTNVVIGYLASTKATCGIPICYNSFNKYIVYTYRPELAEAEQKLEIAKAQYVVNNPQMLSKN